MTFVVFAMAFFLESTERGVTDFTVTCCCLWSYLLHTGKCISTVSARSILCAGEYILKECRTLNAGGGDEIIFVGL